MKNSVKIREIGGLVARSLPIAPSAFADDVVQTVTAGERTASVTNRIARTSLAILLAGAFVLSGQAANAATVLPPVSVQVVGAGATASIPLQGIAANSISATLKVTGSGAWRSTAVTGCLTTAPVAGCVAKPIITVLPGAAQSTTVTVPVSGTAHALKVFNASASVKLQIQVVSQVAAPVVPKPAPAPAPDPAPAPAPAPAPVSTGRPSASNTGVPAGTNLTVHDGNITVTTPGTVLNALDIRGVVTIQAANVTIKNSIIRGRANSGNTLVNNLGHYPNLVVTDSELVNANAAVRFRGITGSDFTATRLNIHGVEDQIHLTGGNVKIIDSYLHDSFWLAQDPLRNYTPTHDDAIQIQSGSNISITGNTIVDNHNAGVMITQDTGDVSNVTFANNFADGGACTINVAEKAYGPVMGMTVRDNTFGRNTKIANCAIIAPTTSPIANISNEYTDGVAVVIHKG